MAYFCILLLLFLLPLATAETSDLLKELESYKSEMEWAVGIKLYTKQYSEIIHYMKEMDPYLVDEEKAVIERISSGLSLAQKGLKKATCGVKLMSEQLTILLLLFSQWHGREKD